jgi:hypothetical protein
MGSRFVGRITGRKIAERSERPLAGAALAKPLALVKKPPQVGAAGSPVMLAELILPVTASPLPAKVLAPLGCVPAFRSKGT